MVDLHMYLYASSNSDQLILFTNMLTAYPAQTGDEYLLLIWKLHVNMFVRAKEQVCGCL